MKEWVLLPVVDGFDLGLHVFGHLLVVLQDSYEFLLALEQDVLYEGLNGVSVGLALGVDRLGLEVRYLLFLYRLGCLFFLGWICSFNCFFYLTILVCLDLDLFSNDFLLSPHYIRLVRQALALLGFLQQEAEHFELIVGLELLNVVIAADRIIRDGDQ